jgi:signal transduction histidine kinase
MRLLLPKKLRDTLDSWSNRLPRPLAIALDLIPADPEYAGEIRGAQISAIVRLTPLAMIASCLNAVIILATFASVGALRPEFWIWALLIFAVAISYGRNWLRDRRHQARRSASRRAIRKAILNGALFGALWGVVPAVTFPHAPLEIQLIVAGLTSGMLCAGGFVLATVPLAGVSYVALVAAGAYFALLQDGSPIYVGLTALMTVYIAVIIVNLNWSASLFVNSLLAEARVRTEVAAREQAQAQAAHAERMTALGELAGGIAHDFNNVLQAVSGAASLIAARPEDSGAVLRQAQRIEEAVDRGGSISRRLLAFARRDLLKAEPVDAAELLAEVGELLAHTIGPEISVHVDHGAAPLGFLADRRQIETVLLNLATNARDAMPNGGRLIVSAAGEALDHSSQAPRLTAGCYVRLSVADSGTGMDAATLARAAEPFFTTKAKGKGTGLGLSMAKGFAEQSGGGFAIESEPGRGTIVSLWLPQAETAASPPPLEATLEAPLGAGRHVLVVDDDELVREILMTSLEDAGFLALGAENGARALEHLSQGARVDALVTDFSMPGMSGMELIREVQLRMPGLPTILLTGHVGDVATDAFDHPHGRPYTLLQKPVAPAELARRLAAVMGVG